MVSSSCRCRAYSILLLCLSLTTLVIPLLYHAVSDLQTGDRIEDMSLDSFHQLVDKEQLLHHFDDMYRLQRSVNMELSKLEQQRKLLKEDVSKLESRKSSLQKQLTDLERTIRQHQVNIENLLMKQAETGLDYPSVSLPLRLLPESNTEPVVLKTSCKLSTCFDFSRCSVLSHFSVYTYDLPSESSLTSSWRSSLSKSPYAISDPDFACLYVAIIDEAQDSVRLSQQLSHWRGDGRNHMIINLSGVDMNLSNTRAIAAVLDYKLNSLRPDFDFILPHMPTEILGWQQLPLLLPVRSEILASFKGTFPDKAISDTEKIFVKAFRDLHSPPKVAIDTDCQAVKDCQTSQWCFCEDQSELHPATFDLIPNTGYMPLSQLTMRLYLALSRGSVPVILGSYRNLPLRNSINWPKAVIVLPRQRVTEVIYILRNILEPDIMALKKAGRRIFRDHLVSVDKISITLLSSVRELIAIPASSLKTVDSQAMYDEDNPMPLFEPHVESRDEILGPVEEPFSSPTYQRNFSVLFHGDENDHSPYLYPHTPWDPALPTDAKYHGSAYGFRPINDGQGGSGKEFSRALGGNHPAEQFTIVVLTYDRPDLLQLQLAQFNGLPYLNKVLVVWNNPNLPDSSLKWPKIHVPIEVVKAGKNSLNNRFIPYEEIETEAVLSLDDDMYLRDFEIIFAFRVWREARDRIVGFPGRYHAWNSHDNMWNYNSNHSCELSMILTGAAFFHKYYMYQYSYFMDQSIRDKVDEYMNCEDIAMNFLVSHLSGKPPIKTTSRWTFRCPTCGDALWIDESHFNERHDCINMFTKVYGYLPLQYTQFRVDSVLFKTRVPADKTKCFSIV